MGGKPRKTRAELEAVVKELGTCVLWAIKFLDTTPREGIMTSIENDNPKVWQERFMDALDTVKYEVDREVFWASYDKKHKQRRKR